MRQFFSFAFLSAISYLCHRVFDKSKWNTKDTAFKVDKSLPRLLPYAVCQIVRFDWNFWWQKYQNHPHVAFRGNNLRPALSGRSKIKPLQPPAPGTRAGECSFFPLRTIMRRFKTASRGDRRLLCFLLVPDASFPPLWRRMNPAWRKRRQERGGLKARAEGTVCLQTRE